MASPRDRGAALLEAHAAPVLHEALRACTGTGPGADFGLGQRRGLAPGRASLVAVLRLALFTGADEKAIAAESGIRKNVLPAASGDALSTHRTLAARVVAALDAGDDGGGVVLRRVAARHLPGGRLRGDHGSVVEPGS